MNNNHAGIISFIYCIPLIVNNIHLWLREHGTGASRKSSVLHFVRRQRHFVNMVGTKSHTTQPVEETAALAASGGHKHGCGLCLINMILDMYGANTQERLASRTKMM